MYEVLRRVSLSRASTYQQVLQLLAEVSSGRWRPGHALASYPRSNQIVDQGLGASCVRSMYVCVCVFCASVCLYYVLYCTSHPPLVFLLDRSGRCYGCWPSTLSSLFLFLKEIQFECARSPPSSLHTPTQRFVVIQVIKELLKMS